MDLFYGILLSAHLGFEHDYNSFNPYIGAALTDSLSVGAYYNSEERLSTFIATEVSLSSDFDIELGLVTGYSSIPIQPMAKLNYKRIFITPAVETRDSKIENFGLVVGVDWRLE